MLDIKKNELLSKHTSFRLGGPAKFFVVAESVEAVKEALEWAKEKTLEYFILGGGSNVLFSGAGFDGLIIRIAIRDIEIQENNLIAGSGAPLFLAIKKSVEAGLSGLENLSGIPGTIGGAVCNNAGAYGSSISDHFIFAEVLHPNGRVEEMEKKDFKFAYRQTVLKYAQSPTLHIYKPKPIILRAKFALSPGNKEELEQKILEKIKLRAAKEPKGFCAGCAFKNIKGPAVAELLEKINFSPDEKNLFFSRSAIPASWFIERADLKGKKIGGAYVADEHANYIMNGGAAKSEDVIMLISLIKQQVRDKFGVQLEEEIEIVY